MNHFITTKVTYFNYIFWCISASFLFSCGNLKQTILFQTDSSINLPAFYDAYVSASRNYQISNMDYIAISVFTNKGEVLIDPNNEFEGGSGEAAGGAVGSFNTGGTLPISGNMQRPKNYLVNSQGIVNLPMVGKVKLGGYTLTQADSMLTEAYQEYYEDPYIVTQYLNKRVVLMGALGDRVIPLKEENITLIELIAMASGGGRVQNEFSSMGGGGNFQRLAKGNNIRILRGRGENVSVQLVDLTSIDGIRVANLDLMPNDVVYVEPRRKIDRQAIADLNTFVSPLSTIISTVTSVISLYLLIENLGGR